MEEKSPLHVYLICLSIFSQIKMSSPNMNNLIITGCILSYTSVIVLGLDSHITSIEAFPYICTARAWMVMWGFTLSFGSMFSKTWRVHSIFTNVQLNKKVVRIIIPFIIIIKSLFVMFWIFCEHLSHISSNFRSWKILNSTWSLELWSASIWS